MAAAMEVMPGGVAAGEGRWITRAWMTIWARGSYGALMRLLRRMR